MAKKLKVGDRLRDYRITKVFGPGMMAISSGAESSDGAQVFLKQYKSPSPTVIWYSQFVDYQQELSRRVERGKAAHYAVRFIDAFEETWGGRTYFAVYELVVDGRGLDEMLDEEREIHQRTKVAPTRDPAVWARHVTWAKVFMGGIAALHEAKIIHADLKPANVFLVKDASLEAGYQLKLIDMDFSVLADRRAPWHGYQGYVGTDNYRSIEHMTRGAVPLLASDIFTSGLILYELLAGFHPYWEEDQAEYAKRARSYEIKPPALLGVIPPPAKNGEVSAVLHRCLSPDPSLRPTAAEVRAALSGRAPKTASAESIAETDLRRAGGTVPPPIVGSAVKRPGAHGAKLTSDRIRFVTPGGATLQIGIRTEIGKAVLRSLGPDAEFWDDKQCTVERRSDGQWIVTPFAETTNETLINGTPITTPAVLNEGDVLAAGRSAKGISKLPLTAHVG